MRGKSTEVRSGMRDRAASGWFIDDIAIKDKALKMLMLESYHTGKVEGVRRTKREHVKCMGIFRDHRIIRLIAIIPWLNEIRHDCADNTLIAEEGDAITGPVF